MAISIATDAIYTYRFLKLLVTPFDKTKAYELGLVDENGKRTDKKVSSSEERAAYNLFHRLVFNIKKVLALAPGGSSRIASYAAALFLLKEQYGIDVDKVLLEADLPQDEKEAIKKRIKEEEIAGTTTADVATKDMPLLKKPLRRKKDLE